MKQTGKPAGATGNAFFTVLLGCLLVFPSLDSHGVNFPLRWRWSNPRPHGNNIVDMAYSPGLGVGVQVAERGQVYTSDDLSTWLPRDSGVTNALRDRKSTRLNSSHLVISYAVFCLKKKK